MLSRSERHAKAAAEIMRLVDARKFPGVPEFNVGDEVIVYESGPSDYNMTDDEFCSKAISGRIGHWATITEVMPDRVKIRCGDYNEHGYWVPATIVRLR